LAPAPNAAPLPPPPGAYGPPPPGGFVPNPADPWQAYRQSYLEDYFTYLRGTLRITEAQRPAWLRFEDAVRANMQNRQAARPVPRDPRAGPAPLPERFAQRRQRLDAERARLDTMEAALRPLYTALSEEQRRIADNVLAPGRAFGAVPPRLTMRERLRGRRPFGRL
jgi:hypothetical protein